MKQEEEEEEKEVEGQEEQTLYLCILEAGPREAPELYDKWNFKAGPPRRRLVHAPVEISGERASEAMHLIIWPMHASVSMF